MTPDHFDSQQPIANSQQPPNVWDYKPWWCQPWSILLTGIGLIGGSWLLLHIVWLTILVALPVVAWMVFFILIYPPLAVRSGMLDGYQTSKQEPQPEDA